MNELEFSKKARELVANYSNKLNKKSASVESNEVYIVWMCKTLQNSKAMLSTSVPDSRYYEVTYNGDKDEFYLDAYVQESNELHKGLSHNYTKDNHPSDTDPISTKQHCFTRDHLGSFITAN